MKNKSMTRKVVCIIIALLLCWIQKTEAQLRVDVARAAAIMSTKKKAEKTLQKQIEAQGMMTTGHIFTKEEIEATTAFQKEFNDYLDAFHDVLSLSAEIYGIYYEVKKTSQNIQNINEVLAESPSNALALAFSAKRNVVYRNIVSNSLDIIMDIRKVCFEDSKMTQKERQKIISGILPKLHKFNKQLVALTLALRYTTFLDVWNEIMDRAYRINHEKKLDVIKSCQREWMNSAKSVKVNSK